MDKDVLSQSGECLTAPLADGMPVEQRISASRLSEAPIEQQCRVLAALSEQCSEGIMVCDAGQRMVFVNAAFERITGYALADVIGKPPSVLHSGRHGRDFYAGMWASIRNTGHWEGEICDRGKDGKLYMEWLSISAVSDPAGQVTHYVGVFSGVNQRGNAEERVRRLASLDPLTQLPNRKSLADRLDAVLLAMTHVQKKAALLLLDLDRFKNVNDSMGHEAGDFLLQAVGNRLTALVRRSDIVARMGGDEFAIVLTNVSDYTDVDDFAAKVLAEVAKPLKIGDLEIEISASIGICLFPDDASGVSEMIRNADTAMYQAKNLGRNARQFYAREMSQYARDALSTETALRRALKQREFELYYQPQIDLRSGEMVGVEALIRWNRPEVGLVMPGDFIPLAEDRGLIEEIGEWTLYAAEAQISKWDAAGLAKFRVAINLSATQFHRGFLVDRIEKLLHAAVVSPHRLELEITEGIIVQDTEATIEIMQRLHRLGVLLSIDDFGTGYSSLSYLRRFPIDNIKIDRSFVNEMVDDASTRGIVRGIIELAHGIGVKVIAEGVETFEQLERLREMNCNQVQGFLVSRPLPAAALEQFLREWPLRCARFLDRNLQLAV